MKKTIVFLNIVALITGLSIVFSCIFSSATDVPIDRFLVVGSLSSDGSSYSNQNITSSVVRNNYTFNFTPITGNSFRSGYLLIYNTSSSNLTDIFTLSGKISFSSDSPFASIDNTTYSVIVYYNNGSQVINTSSSVLSNHSDFNLNLSVPYVSSIRIDFTFAAPILSRFFSINISDFKFDNQEVSDLVLIEAIEGINNRLDQTNNLLEEGLTFVPSSSTIEQESGDLGGGLLDDLGSGAADINAAIDDHIPDVSSWLANNPQIYQDMLNLSGLANYVMLGIAHSDPSIFIYLSLMAFVSLLMVIEVNLKRGPTSFHIHQVAQRHYVNNQRSSHHFGFN